MPAPAVSAGAGRTVYYDASFCIGGTKTLFEDEISGSGERTGRQTSRPANSWSIYAYHDSDGNGKLDQDEYDQDPIVYETDKDGFWSSCAAPNDEVSYEEINRLPNAWQQIIVAEAEQPGWRETYPTGTYRNRIPMDLTPPIPAGAIASGPIKSPQLNNMHREQLAPNGYVIDMAALRKNARRLEHDQKRLLTIELLQDLSFENEKISEIVSRPPRRPLCPGGRKQNHRVLRWFNGAWIITSDIVGYVNNWDIYVFADDNENGQLDQDEYRHGPDIFTTNYGWGCLGDYPQTDQIKALLSGSEQVIVVEEKKSDWVQTSPMGHLRSIIPAWLEQKLGPNLIVSKKVLNDNLRFLVNRQGNRPELEPNGYVIRSQELLNKVAAANLSRDEYSELERVVRERISFGNAYFPPQPPSAGVQGYKREPGVAGNGLKDFTVYAYSDADNSGTLSRDEYFEGPDAKAITRVDGRYDLTLWANESYIIVEEKQFDYDQRAPVTSVLELSVIWEPNRNGDAIRLERNGFALSGAQLPDNAVITLPDFVNEHVPVVPITPCNNCVPEFCPAPKEVRDNARPGMMDPVWGLARRPRPPRRDQPFSPYTYRYRHYEFKENWMVTASQHIDQFVEAEVTFYDDIASPDPLPESVEIDCRYSTTLDDGSGGKLILTVEPAPVMDKSFIVESLQIVSDPPWSKFYDNTQINVYECDHRHDSCAF